MWNAYLKKEYADKIKAVAKKYAGRLLSADNPRMKNEEIVTILAYLAYKRRKNNTPPSSCLTSFVRNKKLNVRFTSKTDITTTIEDITSTDDAVFSNAIDDVDIFIKKLEILTGTQFSAFSDLVSHSKGNSQSKTNQNLYLLWITLENLDMHTVKFETRSIYAKVKNSFSAIQQIEGTFNTDEFIHQLSLSLTTSGMSI